MTAPAMHFARAFAVMSLSSLLACSPPSVPIAQLRIVNGGKVPIQALTVVCPEGEVLFGDIPVGATTPYKVAPGGVYSNPVYRYKIGRVDVTQGVRDRDHPMGRARYTFKLDFDPGRTRDPHIRLVELTNDG